MPTLAGPLHAAAVLLLLAGLAKVLRPLGTSAALAASGLPAHPALARLVGVAEILLAGAVLLTASPLAAGLLALAYLGFTAFAARLLVLGGEDGASCGCFGTGRGEGEAPVTRTHLVVTVLVAAVAGAAAVTGTAPVLDATADTPLAGVPYLLGVVGLAAVAHLALTALPELQRAASRVQGAGPEVGA